MLSCQPSLRDNARLGSRDIACREIALPCFTFQAPSRGLAPGAPLHPTSKATTPLASVYGKRQRATTICTTGAPASPRCVLNCLNTPLRCRSARIYRPVLRRLTAGARLTRARIHCIFSKSAGNEPDSASRHSSCTAQLPATVFSSSWYKLQDARRINASGICGFASGGQAHSLYNWRAICMCHAAGLVGV